MQRTAVLVEVNLDPTPGACSTPESWRDVIQDLLNGVVGSYEPVVSNVETMPHPASPNRSASHLGPANLARSVKRKTKILWGNIFAYFSMLALTGVLLWILVAYTNKPR